MRRSRSPSELRIEEDCNDLKKKEPLPILKPDLSPALGHCPKNRLGLDSYDSGVSGCRELCVCRHQISDGLRPSLEAAVWHCLPLKFIHYAPGGDTGPSQREPPVSPCVLPARIPISPEFKESRLFSFRVLREIPCHPQFLAMDKGSRYSR